MKRILSILIILIVVPLLGFKSSGGTDTITRIKTIFLYQFTKYIEWPETYKAGNFVIGVYGETPVHKGLETMAKTKKTATQSFEIKKFNSISEISKCHVLFVAANKSAEVKTVLAKVKTQSTLLVTEKTGLALQGASINFVSKDNKQKFEMNKGAILKQKLRVNGKLEALAILVK